MALPNRIVMMIALIGTEFMEGPYICSSRGLSRDKGVMIKAIRPVWDVVGWEFADGMDAAIGWNGI
jgi:hypothetical protein